MPINANAFCGFPSHPYIRHCLAMLNVSRVARKTMLLRVQSCASGFLQFLNSLKSTREEPRPPNSTENERYPLTLNTHHHSSLLTSSPSLLFSTLSTPPSLLSSALPHPPLSSPLPSHTLLSLLLRLPHTPSLRCPLHEQNRANIYCETCQKIICHECALWAEEVNDPVK